MSSVNLTTNANPDPNCRFEPGLDEATGYTTRDAIAVPLTDVYGHLIGGLVPNP